MQVVTEQDVLPAGFQCESCGRLFKPGDNAYGIADEVSADGTPIETLICLICWAASTAG